MVLLQRNLYFSKDPEGVQHFPRGGPSFSRGVSNANFSLDPHMKGLTLNLLVSSAYSYS